MMQMLLKELNESISFENTERFYTTFYRNIVVKSEQLFPMLSYQAGSIFTRKFGDILLCYINKKNIPVNDDIITKNLNNKEILALQYLGGYVLSNMYQKCRNSKHFEHKDIQEKMALLKAGKAKNEDTNSKLVEALSRGGLWKISDAVQKIFVLTEKIFCLETSKQNFRKINVFLIVKKLMEFPATQDFYKVVIENAEIEISNDVAKATLFGMLTLYVRIRSFSFTKDVVQKHKIKVKQRGKAEALRKSLKQSFGSQDNI